MRKKTAKEGPGLLVTIVLFVVMLSVLLVGTLHLSGGANDEGVRTTREAIERAAVLCYATEGYYPPGLSYIENNYGVQIDYSRYVVRYEVFASNIMPRVQVLPK